MDSENITVKPQSSLLQDKGRFLLLFLLFAGFQITRAVCLPDDAYDPIEIDGEAQIIISEGAVISGLENLHIASAEIKNTRSQQKHLQTRDEKKPKTKKTTTVIRENLQPTDNFSNNSKTDTHVGSSLFKDFAFGHTSFSFKCILANEMKTLGVLFLMISIFITNFYKSRSFSDCHFLQNFQRPPPKFSFDDQILG